MSARMKPILIAILLVVVLPATLAGFWVWNFVRTPGVDTNQEVILEVTPGHSFVAVAKELETKGVIRNARAFSWYARLTGQRALMKVGEYAFNTSMKPGDVLATLVSGRSIARPFTVSEGLNIFEISELYEKSDFGPAQDFLIAARDPKFASSLVGVQVETLEGYLFPETYQITKFTTVKDLITSMVKRFLSIYKEVETKFPQMVMTRHQVVTLASIIEKETGAPQERPLISSVFHNRMVKKMRLQTDPTVIYGMTVGTGKVPLNIRRSDLLRPTPYNTYVIYGLPPGPIANPGREALLAAVSPQASEFFYFVSRNDGTHVFSKSYEDHNMAVQRFQLDAKAREGKSWRDLTKGQKK